MSAEASIRIRAEDSASSVAVMLLDIQFLFTVQAPRLLGAKYAYLRREGSYSGGHWIIWKGAQYDVIAEIFREDGTSAPALAYRRRDGDLTPT